jgi:hypothetical protein
MDPTVFCDFGFDHRTLSCLGLGWFFCLVLLPALTVVTLTLNKMTDSLPKVMKIPLLIRLSGLYALVLVENFILDVQIRLAVAAAICIGLFAYQIWAQPAVGLGITANCLQTALYATSLLGVLISGLRYALPGNDQPLGIAFVVSAPLLGAMVFRVNRRRARLFDCGELVEQALAICRGGPEMNLSADLLAVVFNCSDVHVMKCLNDITAVKRLSHLTSLRCVDAIDAVVSDIVASQRSGEVPEVICQIGSLEDLETGATLSSVHQTFLWQLERLGFLSMTRAGALALRRHGFFPKVVDVMMLETRSCLDFISAVLSHSETQETMVRELRKLNGMDKLIDVWLAWSEADSEHQPPLTEQRTFFRILGMVSQLSEHFGVVNTEWASFKFEKRQILVCEGHHFVGLPANTMLGESVHFMVIVVGAEQLALRGKREDVQGSVHDTSDHAQEPGASNGSCVEATDFQKLPPKLGATGSGKLPGKLLRLDSRLLVVGTRVRHEARGIGRIVEVNLADTRGKPYHVQFDSGEYHCYSAQSASKLKVVWDMPAIPTPRAASVAEVEVPASDRAKEEPGVPELSEWVRKEAKRIFKSAPSAVIVVCTDSDVNLPPSFPYHKVEISNREVHTIVENFSFVTDWFQQIVERLTILVRLTEKHDEFSDMPLKRSTSSSSTLGTPTKRGQSQPPPGQARIRRSIGSLRRQLTVNAPSPGSDQVVKHASLVPVWPADLKDHTDLTNHTSDRTVAGMMSPKGKSGSKGTSSDKAKRNPAGSPAKVAPVAFSSF